MGVRRKRHLQRLGRWAGGACRWLCMVGSNPTPVLGTPLDADAIVNNLQLSLSLVGRRRRSLRQSFLSGVGDGGGRGNEGAKMFEYFAAADPPTVGALEAGVLQFPRSLTLPAGTLTYAAVLAGAACLDLDVRASSGSVRSWLADTESLAAFEAANLTVTPSKEPWVAAGPSACAGAACNASLALDPDTMYIWVLLNDGKEDATLTTQYAAHSVQAKGAERLPYGVSGGGGNLAADDRAAAYLARTTPDTHACPCRVPWRQHECGSSGGGRRFVLYRHSAQRCLHGGRGGRHGVCAQHVDHPGRTRLPHVRPGLWRCVGE